MMRSSSKIHVFEVSKSTGGVGTYTRRLVKALDKSRFRITVACLSTDGENMAEELSKIPGVTAFAIPMAEYNIDPLSDLRVLYRLFREIRSGGFDLIHAHTSKPGFLVRLAAMGSRIPVIYRPANFSFYDGVSRGKVVFYVLLERFASRFLTDKIMVVSPGEQNLARRYNVGKDEQFTLIRTGIDVQLFNISINKREVRARFGIPENVPLIGTVARLTADKAPFDFAEAASIVNKQNPDIHFLWIGDGPLEDELKEKIKLLNLAKVFYLAGHQKNVPELLRSMDCFVLSSTSEALSIAMLEAMAAGLPVISTNVNGADEAIHQGINGVIVPIGDVRSMAEEIIKLVENSPQRQAMGQAAQKRMQDEFSLAKMTRRVEELYEEILRNRTGL